MFDQVLIDRRAPPCIRTATRTGTILGGIKMSMKFVLGGDPGAYCLSDIAKIVTAVVQSILSDRDNPPGYRVSNFQYTYRKESVLGRSAQLFVARMCLARACSRSAFGALQYSTTYSSYVLLEQKSA